jgi:pimeloyl-ACP methyl ester carboxylesterase
MPYVTVGRENSANIDLYYEDHGTGKPIVLIHGFPLSGRAWERQTPVLVDAGYRVITYDRRGFGQSSQPTTGYDYDTFAEDLRQVITKLELRDVVLAGHSMGSGEVARYIGKNGTRGVSGAVFIAGVPPCLRQAPDNPDAVPAKVFEDIKKAIAADRPKFLTQFFADFYNVDVLGGKSISNEAVQASWNIGVSASPAGTLACVDTWGTDFRADLKRVDVPALVIHGDSDRTVPVAFSGKRTAAMIKGSKLVVVEGAPHGLAWTHGEVVNRELLAFLTAASSAAAV